jgi:diguanylate cyclase (GGDEF)-like protein
VNKVVVVVAIALSAIGAALVTLLSARADDAREAQVELVALRSDFDEVQTAWFRPAATASASGSSGAQAADVAERAVNTQIAQLMDRLREMRREYPEEAVGFARIDRAVRSNSAVQRGITAVLRAYPKLLTGEMPTSPGARRQTQQIVATMFATESAAHRAIDAVDASFASRAERARTREIAGSIAVIAVLLALFGFYFWRARQLHNELERLLDVTQREAMTDPLTGLANRRALIQDLDEVMTSFIDGGEAVLALYDLNGFKNYNDSFGHPAGDALLVRVAERLTNTVDGSARAYRMGGDEFCVLIRGDGPNVDLARRAADVLSESGEGFSVTAAFGHALLPADARDRVEALRVADQRLYRHKAAARPSPGAEATAALMTALQESGAELGRHVNDVARLACETAEQLGLPQHEVEQVELAGALHDIGKIAIPDSILNKPGPLNDSEREFIRRHTLIGARILAAAPSLVQVAPLVRSSHEWVDGSGYPEGLAGDDIPIGARIVAVCDAFDAMTSERPYSTPRSARAALAELEACIDSQFDPLVVRAFADVIEQRSDSDEAGPRPLRFRRASSASQEIRDRAERELADQRD